MANVEIKIKRSEVGGSAPSTSDLAVGELAMNPTDGKLYTKTSGDSIVVIGEKNSTSSDVSDGLKINASDIFTNFVKDMEDHGRTALHTEAGFVDELESSNDMIDETNSTGYSYESTDDYYTNSTSGGGTVNLLSDGTPFTNCTISSGSINNGMDNNTSTNINFLSTETLPRHYGIQFNNAKVITEITINVNGGEERARNVSFNIAGSNDGSNYTILHSETGYNFAHTSGSNDTFTFSNSTSYIYYKMEWTSANHNQGLPTWYNTEMIEAAVNVGIDLRTKQWTGTNDTPEAPASSPRYIYLFVVDEHTSGTPQYAVTRNGTNYTNVTFDTTWTFNGTKVARRAVVDMLGMSTGTDPRMKVTNSAGDDYKLHAVGLQTRS